MILLALAAAASACAIHIWQQQTIIKRLNAMPTETDLDNKLAELKTAIADKGDQLATAFAEIKKKLDDALANNQPQPDLSDEIASVDALIATVRSLNPAVPPGTPPAETPAPAPEAPPADAPTEPAP